MSYRQQFIELMEKTAGLQGMTPTASKILALLMFDGIELSFSELAKQLGVSRGNISMNTKMLEGCKVITRVRYKGDRQDYFRMSENLYSSILTTYADSLIEAATQIKLFSNEFPSELSIAKARIEKFSLFYNALADAMNDASIKMAN